MPGANVDVNRMDGWFSFHLGDESTFKAEWKKAIWNFNLKLNWTARRAVAFRAGSLARLVAIALCE